MVIYCGNKQEGTNLCMTLNSAICICWSVVIDFMHRTVCCESCCTVSLGRGVEKGTGCLVIMGDQTTMV